MDSSSLGWKKTLILRRDNAAEHDGNKQLDGPPAGTGLHSISVERGSCPVLHIFLQIGSRQNVLYHFRHLGWFTPKGLGDF